MVVGEIDLIGLLLLVASGSLSLYGACHALLSKRDPRSALAWMAICLALPFIGFLTYFVFGKNRIQTRARRLQKREHPKADSDRLPDVEIHEEFRNLSRLAAATSLRPLLGGNHVSPLYNGEEAYPAMLAAIRKARSYVYLTTYIFETRRIGSDFINALVDAHERGVIVRVLIDGVGEKYDFPWASRELRKRGVSAATYLPPTLIPLNLSINLRNHRKLLLVDGEVAFTGGMNIRHNHFRHQGRNGFMDVHFELSGPILSQLERVFINDWTFTTGETLLRQAKQDASAAVDDDMACRVLLEGPNEDIDQLSWVLVGAVSLAKKSIAIMTPYFLPSRELMVALQTAALRGVDVNVVLPGKNNLPFMTWATMHVLPELLESGVKVHLLPPPFVHTKLFVVDDYYVQLGSCNLDPRSLNLNFELVVEVYDEALAKAMATHVDENIARAEQLDIVRLRRRPLWRRLRNAFFWLFSPYL